LCDKWVEVSSVNHNHHKNKFPTLLSKTTKWEIKQYLEGIVDNNYMDNLEPHK